MELVGRADPRLDCTLAQMLEQASPEVVVDFTRPDTALENALRCLRAGAHVVIGTTGFDLPTLTEQAQAIAATQGDAPANLLVAPNFAIGAVLMMRFAAEAAKHMAKAEIVELHHDGKLDAPSGTAARTAQADGRGRGRRAPADPFCAPAGPGGKPGSHPRRRRPNLDDPPRHDRARVVHAGRAAGYSERSSPGGHARGGPRARSARLRFSMSPPRHRHPPSQVEYCIR